MNKLFLFSTLACLTAVGSVATAQSYGPPVLQAPHADIKNLSAAFAQKFAGPYEMDPHQTEKIGEKTVPLIRGNQVTLNNNPELQTFASRNNANATIFVKVGDEFVRTATNLVNPQGVNARGTILDHDSPAYKNLIAGNSFTGKVVVYGQEYNTKYDLIKDKKGRVIGAFLVATRTS